MPLRPSRVSGRRGRRSPTAEILGLESKRWTRSKSREEESRGKRINFYVQEIVTVSRAGNNRSREQQDGPGIEEPEKPSKKGGKKKKTATKKTAKSSTAKQQQRRSDAEWEDQPDEPEEQLPPGDLGRPPNVLTPTRSPQVLQQAVPPLNLEPSPVNLRRSPRHLQPPNTLPRELSRSPIAHVASLVHLDPVNRLRTRLQQFRYTEERPTTAHNDPPSKSRPTKATRRNAAASTTRSSPKTFTEPVSEPSTSGVGRATRKSPAGIVAAAAPPTQAAGTSGDANSETGSHSQLAKSPPESPRNKGKNKVKPQTRIQPREKMTSPDRDSASSADFPSFECSKSAEVDESAREINGRGTEAEVGDEIAEDLRNDSAASSRANDNQPSTSGLGQKTPVDDLIPSSDEDEEAEMAEPVEKIDESPDKTSIQGSGNTSTGPPVPSIFDPDVSLHASEASPFLPDLPTASSTHHHESMHVDEDLEDIIGIPKMPPKTPGRKHALKKKVQFKSRSEHFASVERPQPAGDAGNSGDGHSSDTTDVEDDQNDEEIESRRDLGGRAQVSSSSTPSNSPVKDKARQKREQFNSRTENIRSIDDASEEENIINIEKGSSKQNVPLSLRNQCSPGTSSTPAPEVPDSLEDRHNLTFDISQISNITLRSSRSSRLSKAPKQSQEVPEASKNHSPIVEDVQSREELVTPINNVDMFEGADETEDTQPQKPSLIQSRAASVLIPQHLSVEVHERQQINLNTKNSPPPLQVSRPAVNLPHNSPEWEIIKTQLTKSCFALAALKKMILQYHKDKQTEWQFKALDNFFSSMPASRSEDFFYEIFPAMGKLALQMPELMKDNIPVRRQKRRGRTNMNLRGAGCLIANGFLSTFDDEEGKEYGGRFLNFSKLFESFDESGDALSKKKNRIVKEKLEFIVSYFSIVADERPDGPMWIERIYSESGPSWWALTDQLRPVRIEESLKSDETGVEVIDTSGLIGGDLFGFTAETEEINSLTHPELMVARLFVEPLGEDEAVFFSGVRRYSNFEGSGSSFRFAGKSDDFRPRNFAFIKWENIEEGKDLERENLIAELNKMYIVFKKVEVNYEEGMMVTVKCSQRPDDHRDQVVKFLIVAMAASAATIPVTFCTFEDDLLNEEIQDLQKLILREKVDIQSLFTGLCEYGGEVCGSQRRLYYYLRKKFRKSK